MNSTRALGPVFTLLLCVTPVPGCVGDPPTDATATDTMSTAGTTENPPPDPITTSTTGAPEDPPPDPTTTSTTGAPEDPPPDPTTTGTTGATEDPPPDASTTGTTGTTGDPPPDTTDTTGTTGDPSTTGPDSDGESSGTTATRGSSSGDDSSGSGTGGDELIKLENTQACVLNAQVAPSLPQEAGHLAATVLTPDTYPFEVSHVRYALPHKESIDCVNTYAHRVEIFVTGGGKPPAKPSTEAFTFVSIDIEESFDDVPLRVIEPKLDPPIVLTDGQSLVVAVSLEADLDAGLSLCLDSCLGAKVPGVDYWSYAAAEPYKWIDLVGEKNFIANFKIYAFGKAL